ncbi:DUF397 domain-containing protein [Nocardia arthritidis]|uniref:DUF397 domain-containing protein n=1 Tax=Nocardia arthritidis TaxID=228602 RepID=UPI000A04A3AD
MNTDRSESKWFKSSYSGADKACVEVAFLEQGHIGVRDSKNPSGPALVFTPGEWDAFTAEVAAGKFQRSRALRSPPRSALSEHVELPWWDPRCPGEKLPPTQ